MGLIYLDSCAAIKLFKDEAESEALESWLGQQTTAQTITSHLTHTELRRGLHVIEADPETHIRANHWLKRRALIALPAVVCESAGILSPGTRLRSLDALHVAAALSLGAALSHFVTYDKRLAAAAADHGLTVVSPA
ncbi:type II toxin-antitoxin system VapC family toxin [Phytomonospora endophytica]|uniref:Ribonuclease VapC n=1 Tax=Phytomonospora endophytica TaxID=714109 RepID=A0A841FE70_9ACTN|nr:type II toxin-antitoxin system VapC family toxin [Phytomonospora endophytica]MBB6034124.1 hypothetical protein [Phytomonospora endophytica]GIG66516.1 ribonuclease VapC [Phytomonospora endophytica]